MRGGGCASGRAFRGVVEEEEEAVVSAPERPMQRRRRRWGAEVEDGYSPSSTGGGGSSCCDSFGCDSVGPGTPGPSLLSLLPFLSDAIILMAPWTNLLFAWHQNDAGIERHGEWKHF